MRKTRGQTTSKIVHAAREQRGKPTLAEKKLWAALRGRRLAGLKFRRQHPYGRFILDAFCVEHQLVVEVDGDVHADPAQAARDAERTEFLQAHGIRVLRFSNEEIENHLGRVLRRIVEATSPPQPPPSPDGSSSPSGEGGRGGEVSSPSGEGGQGGEAGGSHD